MCKLVFTLRLLVCMKHRCWWVWLRRGQWLLSKMRLLFLCSTHAKCPLKRLVSRMFRCLLVSSNFLKVSRLIKWVVRRLVCCRILMSCRRVCLLCNWAVVCHSSCLRRCKLLVWMCTNFSSCSRLLGSRVSFCRRWWMISKLLSQFLSGRCKRLSNWGSRIRLWSSLLCKNCNTVMVVVLSSKSSSPWVLQQNCSFKSSWLMSSWHRLVCRISSVFSKQLVVFSSLEVFSNSLCSPW